MPDGPVYRAHLCLGKNCSARGSQALLKKLEREVRAAGLADRVEVAATSCRDRCDFGPSMNVYPGPVFYNQIDEDAIEEIVTSHFLLGRPVERCFFKGADRPRPGLSASASSALDRLFGGSSEAKSGK
jgi:NADH-quinone oxidoreductase subunit F